MPRPRGGNDKTASARGRKANARLMLLRDAWQWHLHLGFTTLSWLPELGFTRVALPHLDIDSSVDHFHVHVNDDATR